MAIYFAWRYSIIENTYHLELSPNPCKVDRDTWYQACKDMTEIYWHHRMLRIVYEVVLEVVEKERRRKEDERLAHLLGDIDTSL